MTMDLLMKKQDEEGMDRSPCKFSFFRYTSQPK